MKQALICLIVALLVSSVVNSARQLDFWGIDDDRHSAASQVPSIPDSLFDDEVIKSKSPVLVDFYRDDSQTSKDMTPVFAEIARRYKDKVKVVRIETAENVRAAQAAGVTTVPDFMLLYKGGMVDHMVGKMSSQALQDFVDRGLAKLGAGESGQAQPNEEGKLTPTKEGKEKQPVSVPESDPYAPHIPTQKETSG